MRQRPAAVGWRAPRRASALHPAPRQLPTAHASQPFAHPPTRVVAAQRLHRVAQLLGQRAALLAGGPLREPVGARVRAAVDEQQHGAGVVRDLREGGVRGGRA